MSDTITRAEKVIIRARAAGSSAYQMAEALAAAGLLATPPEPAEWAPCPRPERGTLGAESHCIHWHEAEDDVTPCCWCGSAEDDSGTCLTFAPPDDTTTKLIEAAIAFAGPTGNIVALFAAVDAYLAAHPEATP